jgi:hypothetical protein
VLPHLWNLRNLRFNSDSSMTTAAITHYIFVDFENVPEVDLGLVEGKPVHVTLFIGKNQKKIDLPLVQQIRRLGAQVDLVEVGASGRNALDLTLSYYLGQAILRAPDALFCIVSRDKDFEPMIAHVSGKGIKVVRRDTFAALLFLPKMGKSSSAKAAVPVKPSAPVTEETMAQEGTPADRLERLIFRLRTASPSRPKKKARLLARINSDFGNKLTEAEQNEKLDELIKRGVLSIDAKGGVAYAAAQ